MSNLDFADDDFEFEPKDIEPEDIKLTEREEKEETKEELGDIYDEIKERDEGAPQKFRGPEEVDFGFDEEDAEFDLSDLPEELQEQLLAEQEEEDEAFAERLERIEAIEDELAPVSQVVDQWSGYLDSLGVEPSVAFDALIRADYALRSGSPEQKQQYLSYLAQTYGVDQDASYNAGNAQYVDPDVRRLETQIAQLAQNQNGIVQGQQAASEQAEFEMASDEVEDFAMAEYEDGSQAFPLLDFVDEQMADLIESGMADGLEDAYEKAIWSDPDCRAELIAYEQEMMADERSSRARDLMRTSTADIMTPNEGRSDRSSHNSLRDELGAIYDELNP